MVLLEPNAQSTTQRIAPFQINLFKIMDSKIPLSHPMEPIFQEKHSLSPKKSIARTPRNSPPPEIFYFTRR